MKKKTVYGLIALLTVFFMSVPLTSCSDDDDDLKLEDVITPDPTNPVLSGDHDPELIGTWVCEENEKDEEGTWNEKTTLTFRNDGRYLDDWVEYLGGKLNDSYWDSGYWATKGNKITFYCTNSSDAADDDPEIGYSRTQTYVIVAGKLIIGDNQYTRK